MNFDCKTVPEAKETVFVFADLNECQMDQELCEQECTDTVAGYECSCSAEFRLDNNSRNCTGKRVKGGKSQGGSVRQTANKSDIRSMQTGICDKSCFKTRLTISPV